MSIIVYFFCFIFAASEINIPSDPQNMEIKTIKLVNGREYLDFFQVVGVHSDRSIHVICNFLDFKSAEAQRDFFSREFADLYTFVFVREETLWIK